MSDLCECEYKFDKEYHSHDGVTEENKDSLKGKKQTILPFFGFKHGIYVYSSTDCFTSGGDYTVTDKGNGEYNIKKNPVRTSEYTISEYHDKFYRDTEPEHEKLELEEKFLKAVKTSDKWDKFSFFGQFDPFKTGYKSPDLRDYYYDTGLYKSKGAAIFGKILLVLIRLFSILSVLLISSLIYCIIGYFAKWYMPSFIQSLFNESDNGFIYLGILVAAAIVLGIILFVVNTYQRVKHSYERISPEKKKEVEERYFQSLSIGIPEADEVLVEYAKKFCCNC